MHYARAASRIWQRLQIMRGALKDARRRKHPATGTPSITSTDTSDVIVIYKLMSNIVVDLARSCDDALGFSSSTSIGFSSKKAIVSYCLLLHLLLYLTRSESKIREQATLQLQRFISRPSSRSKGNVPDLGELLAQATLVLSLTSVKADPPVTWAKLSGSIVEEALTRDVSGVLREAPELEVIDTGANEYRLFVTFQRSKARLHLLMLQVAVMESATATYASNPSQLDRNYGFAEEYLHEHLANQVEEIYEVTTWAEFFKRVRYEKAMSYNKEQTSEMLRQAMHSSAKLNYHMPWEKMLQQKRRAREREFSWLGEEA